MKSGVYKIKIGRGGVGKAMDELGRSNTESVVARGLEGRSITRGREKENTCTRMKN